MKTVAVLIGIADDDAEHGQQASHRVRAGEIVASNDRVETVDEGDEEDTARYTSRHQNR